MMNQGAGEQASVVFYLPRSMDRIEFFVGHFRVVPMATVPWDHGISGMAAPLPGLMEHRTGLAVAGIF
jgi:hypothetical protein